MPIFCPQCGHARPEEACPIHGNVGNSSGLYAPVDVAAAAKPQRAASPPPPTQVRPAPEQIPAIQAPQSLAPQRPSRTLPRPISTVMDPLQPLPRRPKPSAPGAWILAGLLLPLAVLVLWLNIRPKGMNLQTRVEQGRDGILRLLHLGPTEPEIDPAIQAEPAADPAPGSRPRANRGGPSPASPALDLAPAATQDGAHGKHPVRKRRHSK